MAVKGREGAVRTRGQTHSEEGLRGCGCALDDEVTNLFSSAWFSLPSWGQFCGREKERKKERK
jgi:hypothetical protein